MYISDFDLRALHAALDEQRRARGLTWAAVAREVDGGSADGHRAIAVSTLTGLRTRRSAEGDGVLQMLLWLRRTPESFLPGSNMEPPRAELERPPRSQILRWDTRAIHAALEKRRAAGCSSWQQVAEQIGGLDARALTRLATGGRTAFPQVMRIVQWLGMPAAQFTRTCDRSIVVPTRGS